MKSDSLEQFTEKMRKTNDFLRVTFDEDATEASIACIAFVEAVIAGRAKNYEDVEEAIDVLCDDMKDNIRKLYKRRKMS
jgi:ribosome-associated translation inhibitor RaiA